MKVGFVGLGVMGGGMAMNLRRAGHDLLVHDLRAEVVRPLVQAGARAAESLAALGAACDVVFTSLPGPQEMRAVALDQGGLAASMRAGSVWFDLTTNSPRVVREVEAVMRERGVSLLDAPVSGGPKGAQSGKLAIYVGGDEAQFERHRGLLATVGDQAMYVGPIGAGNVAKLAHNCASFSIRMVIAETFTMGVKAGVDPAALWHAMRQGASGRKRTFDIIGERFLMNRFEPAGFALRLARKDMALARELAEELGVPMRHADLTFADQDEAIRRGWGDHDSYSPTRLQKERAGVEIELTEEEVRRTLARD